MTDIFIVKWIFAFSPAIASRGSPVGPWATRRRARSAAVTGMNLERGSRAGAAGWFVALITAALIFGAHPKLIAYSQMKGVLLSLNVLYIIWTALLLFNIVNETGAIKAIGIGIQRFSGDKSIQIVIFGIVCYSRPVKGNRCINPIFFKFFQ